MWQRWAIAALGLMGLTLVSPALAAPVEVTLARDREANFEVVVGEDASARVREAAGTLAEYLERMSGATFNVSAGEGDAGIVVGVAPDFARLPVAPELPGGPLGREDYLLRSDRAGLWLIGATELAVEHAVWDVLHRLGHRQYFPGETWEIVPAHDTLRIAVDGVQSPDYHSRRIWYNWGLWGYNDEPYRQWTQRNRVVQGFNLRTGHTYGRIIRANREAFANNPGFYALVDGERRHAGRVDGGGNIKFCIGNEELRQLVVAYAVRQMKANRDRDSISMDPSDGGHWCECDQCAALGSVSDQALTLANEVAAAINDPSLGLGEKFVGMYAYNRHAPPPSIDVHPNVIMSVATHFLRDGYTLDEIVAGWSQRGATLGVRGYFSVIAWDWNLPRLPSGEVGKIVRPHRVAQKVANLHEQGARFYSAESGDAWGPYGLSYYIAGRTMWDVSESRRVDEIIEAFLTDCFGPAREPMAAFYEVMAIETGRRPLADVIARMYHHLAEARELTGDDSDVRRRIDELVLCTRYAELYKAFADATGDARAEAREAMLTHAYRMRETMMVHTYGLWRRIARRVEGGAGQFEDDQPFTADDVARILERGIARHEPMSPPTFTAIDYSEDLVPAAERLSLGTPGPAGTHPPDPQDLQNYFVWVGDVDAASPAASASPRELALAVRVERRWHKRPHHIRLLPPAQAPFGDVREADRIYCKFGCCAMAMRVEPEPVDHTDVVEPDGELYDVTLTTPFMGLHRLEVIDGGDYTRIDWPEDVRVTIPSGKHTPGVTNHFRGPWSLYFYVPKGTEVVAGWASRIGFNAPAEPGVVRDGDGNVVYDFADHEDGYFAISVPEGQDGRLWRFDDNVGKRLLMTVPPYLARTAEDLLLPAEVVDRDE